MTLRSTLSHPYIKRFYIARFISNFGNGMGPIALAFGILHLDNGSASELGIVLAAMTISMLCVLPFGGVIADKYGRIRMFAIADIVGGTVLLVQVYYFHTGHVPIAALLFSNIGFGLMWGIFWPAFTGALPALLPESQLQQGNAINQFIQNFALITGTAIGGFLVAQYGSTFALGVDAFTFLISGILVIHFRHLTPPHLNHENSMLEDLREGWKVFRSFPWIVITVAGFSLIVMVWSGSEGVLGPLVSLKYFHGAKSWAFVLSCESAGYIVGSLIAMRIQIRHPMRFLTWITFTISIYIFTLAKPQSIIVIAIAGFMWGITLDLWGSLWSTAFQRTIPREALSRASAFDGFGTMMLRPVGLAIAGPLATWIGLSHTLELFAGITAVVILAMALIPAVRCMELPAPLTGNS